MNVQDVIVNLGERHDDIKGSILQDKNRINEIIDEIVTKHTASGIYRYILSLEIEELNKLEYLKILKQYRKYLQLWIARYYRGDTFFVPIQLIVDRSIVLVKD